MKQKGCLICGEEIKAKYLCSKHHQRLLRTGSVYLKGEKVEKPIEVSSLNKPKEKGSMGLSKMFGL